MKQLAQHIDESLTQRKLQNKGIMKSLFEYINEAQITAAVKKAGVTKEVNNECINAVEKFCQEVGMDTNRLKQFGLFWDKQVNAAQARLGKRFVGRYDINVKLSDETKCPEIDKITKKINSIIKPVDPLYDDYESWYNEYGKATSAVRDDINKSFSYIIIGSKQYDDGKVHIVGYSIGPQSIDDGKIQSVNLYVYVTYETVE